MPTRTRHADDAPDPRFEFRSFGQDFDAIHHRLGRLSVPLPEAQWERHSDETYIVSCTNDVHNSKIRDDQLDIKTLMRTVADLEQWKPLLKARFPLTPEVLRGEVFPALGTGILGLSAEPCELPAFLAMLRGHPDVAVVQVRKQRFAYRVHDTICEYAVVLINGARVVTVSSESTDPEAIRRTMHDTGMAGLENVNYLQAIKRVIGMVPMALAVA